mgnify:FL=1|tara:strand:+ start:867 stop:1166 length:300 start_codon:yes stop_codon:yes gene_type:complete
MTVYEMEEKVEEILVQYLPDSYPSQEDLDNLETLQMTFASDDLETFTFQSGDNSFSGACYGLKHWGVVELAWDSDCKELAIDAVAQIADAVEMERELAS